MIFAPYLALGYGDAALPARQVLTPSTPACASSAHMHQMLDKFPAPGAGHRAGAGLGLKAHVQLGAQV